jgi:hypothetical protein
LVILDNHLNFYKLIKEYKIVKRLHTDIVNSALNISTEEGGTIIIYKFRDDRWMIETFDIPYLEDLKFACDGRDGLFEWFEYWKKKLR